MSERSYRPDAHVAAAPLLQKRRKYPAIGQSWRRNWEAVIPFAFPVEGRKIIYTTNAIESLNASVRKAIRHKGHFPNDQAATQLIWLALRHITENWKRPPVAWQAAKAQFALGLAGEARDTLDALIAANPKYRSSDGHLLYARALEAMGETAAALHEYETLAPGYPGEEGRARYAQLLLRDGQRDKAQAVFNDIIRRSSLAPDYYRRDQREWIDLAKREVRA